MESAGIRTDFLVIGSGLSGLNFSLRVSDKGDVIVLTKKHKSDANTNYAQGGIAVVMSEEDSIESHIEDTLKAGEGICNYDAVKIMVEEGIRYVKELIELGVRFSKKIVDGKEVYDLWQEGGHSHRRILHSEDLTGKEIERTLLSRIREKRNIRIFENILVFDLITEDNKCFGVSAIDLDTGEPVNIYSKITILCTGGGSQVYLHTTNPEIATGDGIAMGVKAGCSVGNLEFVQFHPTTLFSKKERERNILISEAVRGEGGILIDKRGRRFMEEFHPLKELAPRDVVARSIDKVLKETGDEYVYLDLRSIGKEKIKKKFPNIYRYCLEENIDITKEPIPVVPAAHYLCGGIVTDLWGRTEIENLYAAGEVSYTGVHGANRLASNSLLEALVFSSRAAEDAMNNIKRCKDYVSRIEKNIQMNYELEEVIVSHLIKEIKQTMWDYVGIVRSDERLKNALKRFQFILEDVKDILSRKKITKSVIELRNLSILGYLITFSASKRKESRGLHFNKDYPEKNEEFKKPTILKKEELWNLP
uniref:L-aspartate oxidase n=1 Tax=candidate division WOR-3 bacterium TaxID=2052148 RepID=A0A7C3UU22_UNCW3